MPDVTPQFPVNVPQTSPKRHEVHAQLRQVSQSPHTPVLICGPAGVGKQYTAWQLHRMTYPQAENAPFIDVNCGMFLQEAPVKRLYGRKLDLTQPDSGSEQGLIDIADGGTLYLAEVSELPWALQAKLVKFLDNMRFRRLYGDEYINAQLRVVAATRKNLQALVVGGQFREDLFQRLSVFTLKIPPLVETLEDVEALARSYTDYFAKQMQKSEIVLRQDAVEALQQHTYPGNIRELRNMIERAVVICTEGKITAQDIVATEPVSNPVDATAFFRVDLPPENTPLSLKHVEREYVACVLKYYRGHRTMAAQALGISYPTFLKRLRELGLQQDESLTPS